MLNTELKIWGTNVITYLVVEKIENYTFANEFITNSFEVLINGMQFVLFMVAFCYSVSKWIMLLKEEFKDE